MKDNRLTRFIIGFVAAILLVIIVGAVTFYTLKQQAKQAVLVEHTYKVLNKVEYISQLMVDMETGRRGFRCTNDKTFLEPYYKSQPKLAGNLSDLKALVADNPVQEERVTQLEKDVLKLDDFWKSININTIYVDNQQKTDVTKNEKALMDIIRADISAVSDAEHSLLTGRQASSSNGLDQTMLSLVIGIVLILLVVCYLIAQVLSASRSREKAENALHDKLAELGTINSGTQSTNWLLTGIREINGSLIGSDSLVGLIESCLDKITAYTGIPAGAFYFYDKAQHELQLKGTIALPPGVPQHLKLNEGITGHAATQKDIIIVNDLPADFWKITSIAGGMVPDTLICVPLWQKKELKGVIELACTNNTTEKYIPLLKAVADNIAIAVNGADSNERMTKLFGQVQEQKEELESQQEELRQTNEELTHQAEILRASEEELRTQEEELKQINVEMEEKTEAVEQARMLLSQKATELEASSKYKSEFLANMSHELRTPLNSVLILAALLKDNKTKNLTDKQIEYSSIIHKSGSDLLELINDILDLSKIEAGKVEVFFEDVAVKEITHDMEQMFTVLAQQKKINFAINIGQNSPAIINTDKQRLEQVIKNLLSNAFKFTPEQGRVSLDVGVQRNHFTISVTDTGIGISPEKQQLIFEAFQQADGSTSRKFGGTGLGLSISKELIKRLHGEIRLTSVAGKGSTFTLLLPLDVKHSNEVEEPQVIPTEPQPVTYNLDNVKEQTTIKDDKPDIKPGEQSILIIEDDPVFAQHVNDFAHSKGYKTIIAVSGDEGIHCARKYKPAAIILDLGLPVIDGRSVLKILKSDDALKNIPVHLVTGEEKADVPIESVESYYQKPLVGDELEQAFTDISTYITEKYKSILILSAENSSLRNMFEKLTAVKNVGVFYTVTGSVSAAKEALAEKGYDCMIVDIGTDIGKGIETIGILKDADENEAYVITCIDGDISANDEKQLKKYSDSIIRRSTQATSRLLDEVDLFLHKIKSTKTVTVPARFNQEIDSSLSGKKVLLADDDMRNVFALTALLEEQGMEVIAAENGKEALALLAKNADVDIVLMDIMMPEMDGYETMTHIRKEDRFKKLPMIALTAKAMTGDREKCLEAGASDYITKPLDSSKLFSLMRVWLAQ